MFPPPFPCLSLSLSITIVLSLMRTHACTRHLSTKQFSFIIDLSGTIEISTVFAGIVRPKANRLEPGGFFSLTNDDRVKIINSNS